MRRFLIPLAIVPLAAPVLVPRAVDAGSACNRRCREAIADARDTSPDFAETSLTGLSSWLTDVEFTDVNVGVLRGEADSDLRRLAPCEQNLSRNYAVPETARTEELIGRYATESLVSAGGNVAAFTGMLNVDFSVSNEQFSEFEVTFVADARLQDADHEALQQCVRINGLQAAGRYAYETGTVHIRSRQWSRVETAANVRSSLEFVVRGGALFGLGRSAEIELGGMRYARMRRLEPTPAFDVERVTVVPTELAYDSNAASPEPAAPIATVVIDRLLAAGTTVTFASRSALLAIDPPTHVCAPDQACSVTLSASLRRRPSSGVDQVDVELIVSNAHTIPGSDGRFARTITVPLVDVATADHRIIVPSALMQPLLLRAGTATALTVPASVPGFDVDEVVRIEALAGDAPVTVEVLTRSGCLASVADPSGVECALSLRAQAGAAGTFTLPLRLTRVAVADASVLGTYEFALPLVVESGLDGASQPSPEAPAAPESVAAPASESEPDAALPAPDAPSPQVEPVDTVHTGDVPGTSPDAGPAEASSLGAPAVDTDRAPADEGSGATQGPLAQGDQGAEGSGSVGQSR